VCAHQETRFGEKGSKTHGHGKAEIVSGIVHKPKRDTRLITPIDCKCLFSERDKRNATNSYITMDDPLASKV
jgi:hypothetical protein